jgi:hypothetical protein
MPSAGGRHLVAQLVQSTVQWGEHLPVPVVDDPQFAGGRAFEHPRGGRISASIRERGPSGTFRAGVTRAMRPGDRNGHGLMLDRDTIAVRLGKKVAGRDLDGRTFDEFPVAPRGFRSPPARDEFRLEIVTDPDVPDVSDAVVRFHADGIAAALAQARRLLAAHDGPADQYGELYQRNGDLADFLTTVHLGA